MLPFSSTNLVASLRSHSFPFDKKRFKSFPLLMVTGLLNKSIWLNRPSTKTSITRRQKAYLARSRPYYPGLSRNPTLHRRTGSKSRLNHPYPPGVPLQMHNTDTFILRRSTLGVTDLFPLVCNPPFT